MKQRIVLVLGGLISAAALYFVFRNIHFADLAEALRTFHVIWLLPNLFLFYWSMYLRGARWAWFFERPNDLNGRALFRPLMIGFAFNCILPGRVGEPVRAYAVSRSGHATFAASLATIVTERIFDAATLLGFLAVSLTLLPKIDQSVQIDFWGYHIEGTMLGPLLRSLIRISAVLVAGVIVFMIPWVQRFCIAAPYRIVILPPKFQGMISRFVQDLSRGFGAVRNPFNLLVIIGYSLAIWGLAVLSTQVLAYGFDGMKMSFLQATAVVSLTAVFILIPAAPGYWGLFEAGVLFTLTVYAVQPDESIATAYALVLHMTQFLPILVIGLALAAQSQIRFAPPETSLRDETSGSK